MRNGWIVALTGIAVLSVVAVFRFAADVYDRRMNPLVVDPDAPDPTGEDIALHRSLFIADLHADTLKWERDLLTRSTVGHVDLPRLAQGNVGLQVFAIVTMSPMRMPWSDCISGRSPNRAAMLAALQGRPAFSARKRALYQVERFKAAVARSLEGDGPELRHIRTADDLHRLIADRMAGKEVIGGLVGVEGAHWIGGAGADPEAVKADVRELYDAGVRVFAPTHRFDNALSGSSEGCRRQGLTDHGRVALREAERLGMVVDLAHISPDGVHDAAELLEKPFMVSHTGVRAGCEAPCRPDRNLSDEEIALIVERGGLVGVGYWPQAIGATAWRIPEVMGHIMDVSGSAGRSPSRHVALGSDYDGSVTPWIDVTRLDVLTTMMRLHGFDEDTIRDIAGLNVCRLFGEVLPGGDREAAEAICATARGADEDVIGSGAAAIVDG